MQAEASTSRLGAREEQVMQLGEQVQRADQQVASLQQAQASMAADAAAKAARLAHLEGNPAVLCQIRSEHRFVALHAFFIDLGCAFPKQHVQCM